MSLSEFTAQLDALLEAGTLAFRQAADGEALEEARVEFLGAKNGRLKAAQKGLGTVDRDDKPAAGKRFNEVKQALEAAFDEAKSQGGAAADPRAIDTTLPGIRPATGGLHPITQTIEALKDIMGRLGFTVADGPEVEDERHNFEALNIPLEHPARDPKDNFYLSHDGVVSQLLLRSQTSTVQIRVMDSTPPPVRIISLGRVYRPDEVDETHYPMFHQMEGLMIDTHVTMADLKTVLRMFATSYLGEDVHIRFRPSFFPFTEPSVEADFYWNGSWMEFGGAGMVDPNVLRAVGYDPAEVSGFAFGLGVERLCMRRHNITDIRNLYRGDVRFLAQFA
ncbi:MAG: phenylalanine--tRNA ligase subunit alpha [Planctomycetales bacterium]|nr:phenylalanine--tRNA ligase subunit alpha [Planctomycetales bacterium]